MNLRFFRLFVIFCVLIYESNSIPLKHHKAGHKLNSKWVRQTNSKDQAKHAIAAAPTAAPVVAVMARRNAHHSNHKYSHKVNDENKIDQQYSPYQNAENNRNNGMRDDQFVQDSRNEISKNKVASEKREALNQAFDLSGVENEANEKAMGDSADLKFADSGFSDDDDSVYNWKALSQRNEFNANEKADQSGEKRVYRDAHSARKRFERVTDPDLGEEAAISDDSNDYVELNLPYNGYVNMKDFNAAADTDVESLIGYGGLRRDRRKARKK